MISPAFTTIAIPTSDITSSSLDESFMEKAIKAVEDNIENPQFSVEELSSIVGMSRDETGAFLGILKIVFGFLMIGVGAANVYHIMKQTRNV